MVDSFNTLDLDSFYALTETRIIPVAWLQKLKTPAKTFEETRLRNDFLFYLMSALEHVSLDSPFDDMPPDVPIIEMKSLLVRHLSFLLFHSILTNPLISQLEPD